MTEPGFSTAALTTACAAQLVLPELCDKNTASHIVTIAGHLKVPNQIISEEIDLDNTNVCYTISSV